MNLKQGKTECSSFVEAIHCVNPIYLLHDTSDPLLHKT